ncbi:MAG: hypothetical protein DRN14_03615 [Thermoplasmata archaeon]|nr:MAG: hypothetical protein DRN14_03615 [Thermoplasmata archaeon]
MSLHTSKFQYDWFFHNSFHQNLKLLLELSLPIHSIQNASIESLVPILLPNAKKFLHLDSFAFSTLHN